MDHRAHYTVPVEREWTEKKVNVPLLLTTAVFYGTNYLFLSATYNDQTDDTEMLGFITTNMVLAQPHMPLFLSTG